MEPYRRFLLQRPAVRRLTSIVAAAAAAATIIVLLLALRHGVDKADPVGSVTAAFLAAVAIFLTVADRHLNTTVGLAEVTAADLIEIRADILRKRAGEADDRGLHKTGSRLLPVTVGDLDIAWEGTTSDQSSGMAADGPEPVAVATLTATGDEASLLWDREAFSLAWARYVMSRRIRRADGTTGDPVRLVIYGIGGVGKTTIALLLTLGLASWNTPAQPGVCEDATTPVPLLISVSGYTGRGGFVRWLNRKAGRLYQSIDRIEANPDDNGPIGRLLNRGRAVLILDGWDEMPSAVKARAALDLNRFVLSDWSLIILSRAGTADEARLRLGVLGDEMDIVAVNPPSLRQRQAYLRHRAVTRNRYQSWRPELVEQLAANLPALPALRSVLSTPMMLDLASRAIGRGETTVDELSRLAADDQKNGTRRRLLQLHVDWATDPNRREPQKVLGHRLSQWWLTYLARVMIDGKTHQLSWWRTVGNAPSRVLAVTASVSVLPAYWLAMQMPVGLTRGLAIGCAVGVGAAFQRSQPMGWKTVPAVLAVTAVSVVPVGTAMRGWKQGTADALEIGCSVSAAYLLLDTLLRSRWPRLLSRHRPATAASQAPAVAVLPRWAPQVASLLGRRYQRLLTVAGRLTQWLAATLPRSSHRLRHLGPPILATLGAGLAGMLPPVLFELAIGYDDPERNPGMVFVGTTFGIGLATIAARAFIINEDTVPQQVRLRAEARAEPWHSSVLVGVLFATAIGLGGAIGGGLRYGPRYAFAVGMVFLFVAGLPVGLVGGTVKWLCSPPPKPWALPSVGSAPNGRAAPSAAAKGRQADSDARVEDETFDRPESAVTMRGDRILATSILAGVAVLAAVSIWLLDRAFPGQIEVIRASAKNYAIGPWDALLVASTLGLIVACTYTVWPVFLVAHLWCLLHRALPWRLRLFAIELQRSRMIIRDGDTYKFRYAGLRTYLGVDLYDKLRANPGPETPEQSEEKPSHTGVKHG